MTDNNFKKWFYLRKNHRKDNNNNNTEHSSNKLKLKLSKNHKFE